MTSSLTRIPFSETVLRGRMRRGLYDWGIQLGAENHHWNRGATAEVGS